MRAIDADALTEIIHGMYAEGDDPSTYHVDVEGDTLIGKFAVVDAIFNMPTIQPEPHWIPVTEDIPDEERECWITPKTTSKVYRGVFTRHYGECHRTGFICDDGFMWLNTALAWMYCEVPEPYKGVTE